jgi:hypothetical protein
VAFVKEKVTLSTYNCRIRVKDRRGHDHGTMIGNGTTHSRSILMKVIIDDHHIRRWIGPNGTSMKG